jgi:hypothetical protein
MLFVALCLLGISCSACRGGDDPAVSHDGRSALTTPTSPRLVRHGDAIELTTYGSGTCPFAITKVEPLNATTVRLVLEMQVTKEPCSADMKPHTEVVQAPSGADPSKWVTASVEFPERQPVRVDIA